MLFLISVGVNNLDKQICISKQCAEQICLAGRALDWGSKGC